MMAVMEELRKEIEKLKHHNATTPLVHDKRTEGDAHRAEGTNTKELEKKKLHDELRSLIDKNKEMAKKMGESTSMDQLLNRTDLLYNEEVMAVSLLPKFKVP